jgi:protein involved in polysaccharide export with SLBB domain
VVRPGKYSYTDNMTLNDVLHSYQDVLPEPANRGEIVRLRPPDYRPETIEFDLPQVLLGNAPIHLQAFDTVRLFSRYEADAPTVTIHGEVRRPGKYPLPEGLTAAQLVRMAGGFKRSALLDAADLASYQIENGDKVITRRTAINIGRAVNDDDPNADVLLKPGDVLTVHQLSGWPERRTHLSRDVWHPGGRKA